MLYLKITIAVILICLANFFFLFQSSLAGFNGWDDWGLLFTYDAFKAYDPGNFLKLAYFTGTPYIWSEVYNIGFLKDVFGFNQQTLRYVEIFFKSLAGFFASFLVFRFTKNKIFTILTVFFFTIFTSTAGPLSHIIFTGAYLMLILMCLSVIFYRRILLSSFCFFLAILACPSRAYLIVPIPLLIEFFRHIRPFKPISFFKRSFIFYFPLLLLQLILVLNGDRPQAAFTPHLDLLSRLHQLASGNLYTLSLPFQAISSLFIDISFVQQITGFGNSILSGFFIINLILFTLSLLLGLSIRKKEFISFALKLMIPTLLLEVIFYFFGQLSLQNNQIVYINYSGEINYTQTLSPSIFQASLGGFYFILGLLLFWQWRKSGQNILLKVTCLAWLWSVFSVIFLYLTSHWYTMLYQSFDRYIIACSLGAVIFAGGIFTFFIQAISKIRQFRLKILFYFLTLAFLALATFKNFKLLDQFFYNWNEVQGESIAWQQTQYQKFEEKIGSDNLKKSILLYIDIDSDKKDLSFNQGSFVYPARFRLFYDLQGKLIRDNCKTVTSDVSILKKSLVTQNGAKGFLVESICTNPDLGYEFREVFYPIDNFYAYKMQNKDFSDIKQQIITELKIR